MLNRFRWMLSKMDEMIENGRNSLDPVVRSIGRKADKLYKQLSSEEREAADWEETIHA